MERKKRDEMTPKKPSKRGPKLAVLKIKWKWQSAINKALKKKKPIKGWPEP